LSGYGANEARKLRCSYSSTYCTCSTWCVICTLRRSIP